MKTSRFRSDNPNDREPSPVALATLTFQRQVPLTLGNGGDSIGKIIDSMLATSASMEERVTSITLDLEPN